MIFMIVAVMLFLRDLRRHSGPFTVGGGLVACDRWASPAALARAALRAQMPGRRVPAVKGCEVA